eukprot:scaffold536_cov409-Prasinococcus_capsulatus_cf.AAC.9
MRSVVTGAGPLCKAGVDREPLTLTPVRGATASLAGLELKGSDKSPGGRGPVRGRTCLPPTEGSGPAHPSLVRGLLPDPKQAREHSTLLNRSYVVANSSTYGPVVSATQQANVLHEELGDLKLHNPRYRPLRSPFVQSRLAGSRRIRATCVYLEGYARTSVEGLGIVLCHSKEHLPEHAREVYSHHDNNVRKYHPELGQRLARGLAEQLHIKVQRSIGRYHTASTCMDPHTEQLFQKPLRLIQWRLLAGAAIPLRP